MTHQPHVSQDIEHVSGLLEVPSQQQPALGQKLKNSYSKYQILCILTKKGEATVFWILMNSFDISIRII